VSQLCTRLGISLKAVNAQEQAGELASRFVSCK
jgi:hypothetical protein